MVGELTQENSRACYFSCDIVDLIKSLSFPQFKLRKIGNKNHETYSVTIVTSVPWDTERVLRLVKTHMGKCLFSPELKSYLITQWNCTTIGSCRCRKRTNGSAAELHEPMATIRANIPAETGGASGYISGRFAIGSSGLLRLKRRLSRAATWHGKVRSTRSVSQGTEVTIVTEYVPYRYSTRTASCKDAYGNWI